MDEENAVLKYVRFRICPSQNRYQAFACDGNKEELLVEGLLGQLVRHLPQLKDLYSGGCEANVKLQWPTCSSAAPWFLKSTFRRFLSIVNSSELFNEIKPIEDEMSQLEKAQKFHLSLYSQVQGDMQASGSGRADQYVSPLHSKDFDDNPISAASESKTESGVEIVASDPSKNELLRAMDSRLKVLREELAASLEQVAGSCSSKDISLMVHCCQKLGAIDLKNCLIKYSELSHIMLILDNPKDKKPTFVNAVGCDVETETRTNGPVSKWGQPVVLADHCGLPSKVVQAESGNAIDEELPSDDSQVDSTGRRRSLVRSATFRRSVSPMRRVQITRVGSRRFTAIGIRSLNHISVRERTSNDADEPANSSDEEVYEKLQRKPETNAQRMSVQAAISLFESKQREENAGIQKMSLGDISKNAKPVRRKLKSCVEQYHVECTAEANTLNSSFTSAANIKDLKVQDFGKEEGESANGDIHVHQAGEVDATLQAPGILDYPALNMHDDTMASQVEEGTERLIASAKWNLQKEAELSMLMKMTEVEPVKRRRPVSKNNTSEQRGCSYKGYKEKRDAKLRGEQTAKKSAKEAQFKAMNQIIEKSEFEMSSKVGKRQSLRKSLPSEIPPQSVNIKKESPNDTKTTIGKSGAVQPSSMPATRKSWPSIPPLESTKISPLANSYVGPSTAKATRRKSQPPTSLASPNSNEEKPLLRKNAQQIESRSSLRSATMHRQPRIEDTNPSKPKLLASSETLTDIIPVKTGLPLKGVKKNSVLLVESKPFLRRGSKVGSAVVPDGNKCKSSPQPKDSVRKSGNTPSSQEREVAVQSPEQVDKHEIIFFARDHSDPAFHSEILVDNDQKIINPETPIKDNADGSINVAVIGSPFTVEEETSISPSAWVEVEESSDCRIMPIPIDDSEIQFAYPPTIDRVETANPYVRQSLSQLLQDEINEREDNMEWGNAEHPPNFYPKDAPSGFKRLLKFGRKSKGDGNSSGWSSPSVFSDGDHDADNLKASLQRNTDNRLRTATHHTKSTSRFKSMLNEGLVRKDSAGITKGKLSNPQRSSYQMGESHNSVGISGTKSSRSFFSLSALRGSK